MPSLTFVATANAVTYTGARPVFADIAATHRPWPGSAELEAVLTPRTKAIVAVPYAGETEPSSGVIEFAAEHGLTLIEDAAHALGATVGGATSGRLDRWVHTRCSPTGASCHGRGRARRHATPRLGREDALTAVAWRVAIDLGASPCLGAELRRTRCRLQLSNRRATRGARVVSLRRLESDRLARTRLSIATAAVWKGRAGRSGDRDRARPGRRPTTCSQCSLLKASIVTGCAHVSPKRASRRACTTRPVHRTSAYGRLSARLPRTEDYARRTLTLPLFAHLTHHQQDMVLDVLRRCA